MGIIERQQKFLKYFFSLQKLSHLGFFKWNHMIFFINISKIIFLLFKFTLGVSVVKVCSAWTTVTETLIEIYFPYCKFNITMNKSVPL